VERRRGNGKGSCGLGGELLHVCLVSFQTLLGL
jgi:hypothetical protein